MSDVLDEIYEPKADLYTALCTLNYPVMQNSEADFSELPLITFYVVNNYIELTLDNSLAKQTIEVVIDIWAKATSEITQIFKDLEALMRSNYYKLTFSSDVPNIDSSVHHMTTRFERNI